MAVVHPCWLLGGGRTGVGALSSAVMAVGRLGAGKVLEAQRTFTGACPHGRLPSVKAQPTCHWCFARCLCWVR